MTGPARAPAAVRAPDPARAASASPSRVGAHVVRRCGGHACPAAGCDDDRRRVLRRSATGSGLRDDALPLVGEVVRSAGRPLDDRTRAFMESRFGHDFGAVRVHTDARAGESARAVGAVAYALGSHVVFAPGAFRPDTPEGKRVLAHELAHTLQQPGGMPSGPIELGAPDAPAEREADRTADAVAHGREPASPGVDGGSVVRRQGTPATADAERRAREAALLCNFPALCALRRSNPDVVTDTRVRSAARACRPATPITLDPCLSPLFMAPALGLAPPGTASPAAPAAAAGGGFSLSDLTTFRFSLGAARFVVELPSSIRASLPAALSASRVIEFSLTAETSGTFSFAARLDGLPHVQIAARAGVDVASGVGSAGLTVTTTRRVCQAASPATLRSQITAAGDRLRDAINALQNPPSTAAGATPPSTTDQLSTVASALSDLYDAVDRAKRPCEQQPVATFGLTAQTPLFPGLSGEPPPPASIGVSATFRF